MTNHQHNSTTNGSTSRLELLQRGKIPIVQPHQLLNILHAHPTPIHEWSHALMDQIEKHPRYDDLLQYLVCWLDDHSSILTCTPSPPHQQQPQQQAPISSSSSLQSTPPQEQQQQQQNEQLSNQQQQSVQSNTPSVNNHSTPATVLLVKSENENNHTNIEEHTATTTTTTLATTTTVTPTTEQQQQPQSQDEQQEKHHMDAVEQLKSSAHPDTTPVPVSTTDAAAAETNTLTTTPQTITIDATTTTPTTTGSVEQVMRELGRKLNSHRSLRMTIRSCIRETLNPNSTATQEAEEANQMTVSEYLRSDVKQMLHVLQMKMEDEMREKIQYKTLAKQLLEKQFAELAGEDRINSVGTGGEPSSSSSTPTTNITTEERVQQEPVKQEPNAAVMNQGSINHQQIASAVASTPLSTTTMITNVHHHHQQQQVITPQQTIPEIMDKVDEVIPADQRQALFRSIFDKVNPDYSRSPKLAPPALSMLESNSLLCSEQPHDILPSTPLHVVYPVHTTQSVLLASIPSVASTLLSTSSSIESMTSSLPTTVTPLQVLIGTNSTTDKSLLASPITPSSNNTYGSDDEDMDGKHISRKSDGTRRKPPKRITTEKLVAFGLIMPGDKIQFRTPKKTIDSVITADGQVIWMNPKTNKPEQFNYLSRWNNRIDLVVEPSVNRPQHNGWDKTFLILDESQRHRSNGQPEINFREIRDKALVMVSQESKSCSTPTGVNRKNKRSAASSSTTARRRRKTPNKSPATTSSPNSNRAMIDDEETEPSSDENESELLLEDEIIIPPPTTPTTPAEGRQKRKRKPSELVSDNAEFERFRKQASRN